MKLCIGVAVVVAGFRGAAAGAQELTPRAPRHAIRGSFSTGVVTESGGDFSIIAVAYMYAWS